MRSEMVSVSAELHLQQVRDCALFRAFGLHFELPLMCWCCSIQESQAVLAVRQTGSNSFCGRLLQKQWTLEQHNSACSSLKTGPALMRSRFRPRLRGCEVAAAAQQIAAGLWMPSRKSSWRYRRTACVIGILFGLDVVGF